LQRRGRGSSKDSRFWGNETWSPNNEHSTKKPQDGGGRGRQGLNAEEKPTVKGPHFEK